MGKDDYRRKNGFLILTVVVSETSLLLFEIQKYRIFLYGHLRPTATKFYHAVELLRGQSLNVVEFVSTLCLSTEGNSGESHHNSFESKREFASLPRTKIKKLKFNFLPSQECRICVIAASAKYTEETSNLEPDFDIATTTCLAVGRETI